MAVSPGFEELRETGRELELASQHKSDFLANMSHELRTLAASPVASEAMMSPQLCLWTASATGSTEEPDARRAQDNIRNDLFSRLW